MRLLLIEDEEGIAEALVAFLERHEFVVDVAPTLAIAKVAILENEFDLVIVDRLLPDGDGISMLSFAKAQQKPQRFILLTALAESYDKIEGLELGALDYIAKPFEPRELLARIRNSLRLPLEVTSHSKQFGALEYNPTTRTFTLNKEPLLLRRTEALVLETLIARPGTLVTRETLEARVYGYDKFVTSNSLESQISRLRKNLAEKTTNIRIKTIRGMGYSLVEQDNED
ncbi:response regulator transcription factor [Shewanella sp. A3A]|uniref:Response regulator transcription factor n=1 Tax=Shewanella electrica TaxID=515560 RepID=A0ABT2FFF8_9GAMM|nr:response regulator transcription factor [Shewanella electrica]MCH1917974.1 response regulator transcription factor [Shewanella ferrihydritica]MCH1925079.1 response regulator transcription factor [Shewanella electrica]MCS4554903.1 response regulator transcription factor [Shewanella electrica]